MEAAEKEEISVEDEAVDKTTFKDCGKIAFYRRQKQQLAKNTTYRALLGSVDTEQDSTRFQIIGETTKPVSMVSPKTPVAASLRIQVYL
ncbi:neutral alpha-glucosidase C isoform X4 [Apodemus sylvaticus]|uniref:neutral alpha-glucosidase C isoform X4 n=1 Tax=Apodemus sylvaticus TaxID=10129 RepID=UPI002244F014|nr:neutral alpha-glucosidase C isoform X4 [Apodemus sylvaticus]